MAYNRNSKHSKNNHKTYEKRDRNKKVSKMFVPKSKRPSHVTVVPRPNEDPARTIKRFLKKCKKERIIEDYLDRRFYEKPSLKRKREKLRKIKNARKAEADRNKIVNKGRR